MTVTNNVLKSTGTVSTAAVKCACFSRTVENDVRRLCPTPGREARLERRTVAHLLDGVWTLPGTLKEHRDSLLKFETCITGEDSQRVVGRCGRWVRAWPDGSARATRGGRRISIYRLKRSPLGDLNIDRDHCRTGLGTKVFKGSASSCWPQFKSCLWCR